MDIRQRIRTIFRAIGRKGARPDEGSFGDPTRTLMARGEGELGGAHDAQGEEVRGHSFGSPNDGIDSHVRPPLS
jgi:hypothetical protein